MRNVGGRGIVSRRGRNASAATASAPATPAWRRWWRARSWCPPGPGAGRAWRPTGTAGRAALRRGGHRGRAGRPGPSRPRQRWMVGQAAASRRATLGARAGSLLDRTRRPRGPGRSRARTGCAHRGRGGGGRWPRWECCCRRGRRSRGWSLRRRRRRAALLAAAAVFGLSVSCVSAGGGEHLRVDQHRWLFWRSFRSAADSRSHTRADDELGGGISVGRAVFGGRRVQCRRGSHRQHRRRQGGHRRCEGPPCGTFSPRDVIWPALLRRSSDRRWTA